MTEPGGLFFRKPIIYGTSGITGNQERELKNSPVLTYRTLAISLQRRQKVLRKPRMTWELRRAVESLFSERTHSVLRKKLYERALCGEEKGRCKGGALSCWRSKAIWEVKPGLDLSWRRRQKI